MIAFSNRPAQDGAKASSRSGVTLIDIVVVLLIMGIMAAVAAPRFSDSLAAYRAKSAAYRVAADLQLARRQAKSLSQNQTVAFDTAARRYSLSNLPHPDHPSQPYVVTLPEGVTLVSADFGGDTVITFNGYGLPDSTGTVVVRSGTNQKSIGVDINGEVSSQ